MLKRCVYLCLSSYSALLFAGNVQQIQPLSFGKIVLTDNSTQRSIAVTPDGRVFKNEGIISFSEPSPAHLVLFNFPPHQQLSITATLLSATTTADAPTNEQFTVSHLTYSKTLTTDGMGNAELFIGARLTSTGNVNAYQDAKYSTQITIDINY